VLSVHLFLFSYQYEIPLNSFLFFFPLSINYFRDDKSLMQILSVVILFPKRGSNEEIKTRKLGRM
jgi:hypothetical protein